MGSMSDVTEDYVMELKDMADRMELHIVDIGLMADSLLMISDGLEFGQGGDRTKANAVRAISHALSSKFELLTDCIEALNKMNP